VEDFVVVAGGGVGGVILVVGVGYLGCGCHHAEWVWCE